MLRTEGVALVPPLFFVVAALPLVVVMLPLAHVGVCGCCPCLMGRWWSAHCPHVLVEVAALASWLLVTIVLALPPWWWWRFPFAPFGGGRGVGRTYFILWRRWLSPLLPLVVVVVALDPFGYFIFTGFQSEARGSGRNRQPSPVLVRLTDK